MKWIENLSGVAWLLGVLVLLWILGGSPTPRDGTSGPSRSSSPDAPDPNYSSIRQYFNGPVWDHGPIRDNSVGGRARERNRQRYNDSLYGR